MENIQPNIKSSFVQLINSVDESGGFKPQSVLPRCAFIPSEVPMNPHVTRRFSPPSYPTQNMQAGYNFPPGRRSSSGQLHAVGCIQISYWTVQGKQGRFRGRGHNEPAVGGRGFFGPGLSWLDFWCLFAFGSDLVINRTLWLPHFYALIFA